MILGAPAAGFRSRQVVKEAQSFPGPPYFSSGFNATCIHFLGDGKEATPELSLPLPALKAAPTE